MAAASPLWKPRALRFCAARDVGAALAVCRAWRADADLDETWAAVYASTQCVEDDTCGGATASVSQAATRRALIERPFGEAAIGWRVAVRREGAEGVGDFACGAVVAYTAASDCYCVQYDAEEGDAAEAVWEVEHTRDPASIRRNPSLAGKSRFIFLSPPGDAWSTEVRRLTCVGPSRELELAHGCRSWKEELRRNVEHVPSRPLVRLRAHEDEVLFVCFDPAGQLLATCSRDRRTLVFRVRAGATARDQAALEWSPFELEAELRHKTAACRAVWWPGAPRVLLVTTEDTTYRGSHGASAVEMWTWMPPHMTRRKRQEPCEGDCEALGFPTRLFRAKNRPFDIHTAVVSWPPCDQATSGARTSLAFLAGHSVRHEASRHVQWLSVWPGPSGLDRASGDVKPLASIRVACGMNYLHMLTAGPKEAGQRLLALTGTTPDLCDQLAVLDLCRLSAREGEEGEAQDGAAPSFDLPLLIVDMPGRHLLTARWSERGDFVLVNSRPHVSAPVEASRSSGVRACDQPVPDLSTSMQLLVLNATSLERVAVLDGHFAFTTKECPFTIYPEHWAEDFICSGGEDGRICIWHWRHQRLIRRFEGHQGPVNAVSWSKIGLLASASDDHTVAVWATPGWQSLGRG